jgi:hypothetical protein
MAPGNVARGPATGAVAFSFALISADFLRSTHASPADDMFIFER